MIYTDEYGRIRSDIGKLDYQPYKPKHPSKILDYNGKNIIEGIEKFRENKNYRNSFLYQTICTCPKCRNKPIFYCKCQNGGRVFFESLSPDWKKHKCPCYEQDIDKIEKQTSYENLYKNLYPHSYDKKNKQLIYKANEELDDFYLPYQNSLYENLTKNIHLLYRVQEKIIYIKVLDFNYQVLYKEKKFGDTNQIISFLKLILSKVKFSNYKSLKSINQIDVKKNKPRTKTKDNFNSVFEDFFSK